ncbi:MAG: hypothetical protein SGILL_009450 [Bacillariaceae sp.]
MKQRFKLLLLEKELFSKEILEQEDFLRLAGNLDHNKMKWMQRLYETLQTEVEQMLQEAKKKRKVQRTDLVETDPQRRLWKKLLEFFNKRQIPKEMKDVILQRLVVVSGKDNNKKKKTITTTKQQKQQIQADITLLEKARTTAMENPMFWSREYKRKLRKVLKKNKNVAQLLKEAGAAGNDSGNDSGQKALSPTSITAAVSEVYAAKIRSPALLQAAAAASHSQNNEKDLYQQAASLQALLQQELLDDQYQRLLEYLQEYIDSCHHCHGHEITTATSEETSSSNQKAVGVDDDDDDSNESIAATADNNKHMRDPVMLFPEIAEPLLTTNNTTDDETAEEVTVAAAAPPVDDIVVEKATHSQQQQLHAQQELRIIKSNLLKFLPNARFSRVAQALSEFLHITTPDEVVASTMGGEGHLTSMIQEDAIMNKGQLGWEEMRDAYVTRFQQIHKLLIQAKAIPILEFAVEEGHQPESIEKSILETFAEVLESKPDKDEAPATTERVRPRKYVKFEAMEIRQHQQAQATTETALFAIDDSSQAGENRVNAFESDAWPTASPTDRMIFIDNLPIDIGRDRLWKAYARVGEIEALEICHYRPELDPGRKSIDDRKKIRSPSSSTRRQRWRQPRTPLYGMILYKEPEAAAKAVVDPLRIFGMVLDKHLMRSHRPSDMTRLYLEDVDPSHDITAIEYELSRILHPDLYVCLDVSAHRRPKRVFGRHVVGLSCIIQLPSFEAAYWAYQKLHLESDFFRQDDEGSSCALHWMETPADAMMYWTRQLNF